MSITEYFGDWLNIIPEKMLNKYRNMLMQATLNGIPIEPNAFKTFRCFKETKPENVKIVLLGQDPYFDGRATGLAFANEINESVESLSPSLQVIKDSVLSLANSNELPKFDPSLVGWAKQGILLLNSALSVRRGCPGSHAEAWRPFIERVITGISAETNCCFVLLGKAAWTFKDCIFESDRGVFMEYHPAYYARNKAKMPNTIWKNMLDYVKRNYNTELKLYD